MVDELTQDLADVGLDVHVISPYYDRNDKGDVDYLRKYGVAHAFNVRTSVGNQVVEFGVHTGVVKGVKLTFLHNPLLLPVAYAPGDAMFTLRAIVAFCKGSLEYLCQAAVVPSLVVTNDWFTGFVPAYVKAGHFGTTFKGTSFVHLIHNLDENYEGRLYFDETTIHRAELEHQLPQHYLMDPFWRKAIINPSRAALLTSTTWATVSKSYRTEILQSSPLAPLLRAFPSPFAYSNGIRVAERRAQVKKIASGDHSAAKALLQAKYFGFATACPTMPVFAFVGRITVQKGVHLILDAAEELIVSTNRNVLILVGGKANRVEEYAARCADKMFELRHRFPNNFWADPDAFFSDGPLVNLGADFALMPSMFEPGGVVQHEFFVAGTPVIAFATGGLKDTVVEVCVFFVGV